MAEKRQLHIVSLGSSFAAGPGIPPQVDANAMRSGQNYAHLVAEKLGARLTDLSVSGATLLNITHHPQQAPLSRHVFPPQIEGLPGDADVVTITAGGNDMDYIGAVMRDAWDATALGMLTNLVVGAVGAVVWFIVPSGIWKPAQEPSPADFMTVDALVRRFLVVLDQVHAKAPNARVFLVEYLALLGPATRPRRDISFGRGRIEHHRKVAATVQKAYAKAADCRSQWCQLVPVHSLSQDHVLGSRDPWVGGFGLLMLLRRQPVLHPNLAGMKAVAQILGLQIQKTM